MCIATNCGKFLKRWEYQLTLPASWETCMQVKKQQNQTWSRDWFKIGKGICQGCKLSPCLFNLYAEYIMRNARLDESQAGIKPGKIKFATFSHLFAMKWWKQMPWSLCFECWILSQLFHSLLSPSSEDSLVSLCFLGLEWYLLLIWDCWYFSCKS